MSKLSLEDYEDPIENGDAVEVPLEDYEEVKAEFHEAHADAAVALETLVESFKAHMTLEQTRVALESAAGQQFTGLFDECIGVIRDYELQSGASLESLADASAQTFAIAMEAIHRNFFERIGKRVADAKTRLGEAVGADTRMFSALKARHHSLAMAIKNADYGQGSVTIKYRGFEPTSGFDGAKFVASVGNAAAFYKNFDTNYVKITDDYVTKAVGFAKQINGLLGNKNDKGTFAFMWEVFKSTVVIFGVVYFVLYTLFTLSILVGILAAVIGMLNGAVVGVFLAGIFGFIHYLAKPKGQLTPQQYKVYDEVNKIFKTARSNYETWVSSLKKMVPGELPGDAGFSIDDGRIEFDYHRSKKSIELQISATDLDKLFKFAGDILNSHKPATKYRSSHLESLAKRLKDENKKVDNKIPDDHKGFDSNFFQEKDVGEGAPMIPIRVSRYMATLADNVLDAVEYAVK